MRRPFVMPQTGRPKLGEKPGLQSRRLRLLVLRHNRSRREGSLAAALVQSMALATISTAGAYPSWVLVTNDRLQVVLGATWAINQADPPWDSPLLGPTGGALMTAIACCCLLSVVTGSSAIALDFLGRARWRTLGPLLHGFTALLVASTAALGSSLLGLMRGRTRLVPELQPLRFTASPGQSLFLAFLASSLASAATGLSCSSPALVAVTRSSRDMGRHVGRRFYIQTDSEESHAPPHQYFSWQGERPLDPQDLEPSSSAENEERTDPMEWYDYLRQELAQASWYDRWWRREPPPAPTPQEAALGEEAPYSGQRREPEAREEESAAEKPWEPKPLPHRGAQRELALHPFVEDALHAKQQGDNEPDQEDPGRGDAELQLSLAPESQKVKSGEKTSQTPESQTAEACLVESQEREKQDSPTIVM